MAQSMELKWHRCQGNLWCNFNAVNLDHQHFNGIEGVYIIWHAGKHPHVVYVGKGNIRDRIKEHRRKKEIQEFSQFTLFVTWAEVAPDYQEGVEAYLANYWKPKVGNNYPAVELISRP